MAQEVELELLLQAVVTQVLVWLQVLELELTIALGQESILTQELHLEEILGLVLLQKVERGQRRWGVEGVCGIGIEDDDTVIGICSGHASARSCSASVELTPDGDSSILTGRSSNNHQR